MFLDFKRKGSLAVRVSGHDHERGDLNQVTITDVNGCARQDKPRLPF